MSINIPTKTHENLLREGKHDNPSQRRKHCYKPLSIEIFMAL